MSNINLFKDSMFSRAFDVFSRTAQDNYAIGVSVNIYNNQIVSKKIYFEFKQLPSEETVNYFLPTLRDYQEYIDQWDKLTESSLCLGLKKFTDKTDYTNYLHIKFKVNPDVDGPKVNRLLFMSKQTGISVEYTGNEVKRRKYFYFRHPIEKELFRKRFNLSADVSHFEYTEFDDTYKIINVYNGRDKQVTDFLISKNIETINSIIRDFQLYHNISPCFYGEYENSIIGIYWSFTGKRDEFKNLVST